MTPAARRVLQKMADDEKCDLVRDGFSAWCGSTQTTAAVINQLLRCMAISVSWKEGRATYYQINTTGRSILRRPELEQEVISLVFGQKGAFTIRDDRIVPLHM